MSAFFDQLLPHNKTFSYDGRYQVKNTTGPWGTENYTYDKNGNRLTKITNGNTTTYNYSAGTNRLSSTTGAEPVTYGYDTNGNITSDGATYTYGDHNRLSSIVHVDSYNYDGRNLRILKQSSIGTITIPSPYWLYFYDQQGKLIAEKDGLSGKFKHYVYLENEPVARIDNNGVNNDTLFLYHADHLGTPVVLTNSSGTVVLRTQYFAFGKVYSQTGSASNNIRFPGQYFDSESNLHYNWWRYYQSKIGRYYQMDPLLVPGRTTFAYALNDPVQLLDRNGLDAMRASGQDFVCLLCTVYAEARGQSCPCQRAVASAIVNRLAQRRSPTPRNPAGPQKTICDVVSEHGEFYGYKNRNYRTCEECDFPSPVPDIEVTARCFGSAFEVCPLVTFFGNNTAENIRYFKGLGKRQAVCSGCNTFAFFTD